MTIKEFEIQLALGSLSTRDKLKLTNNKRTSDKILLILYADADWYIQYASGRCLRRKQEIGNKVEWSLRN
ncbi:hypothetical protein LCGC14_2627800 [marine sediment metagenome]|uniref:Uncharacterized protein n=1 Tax=marine sediment metagenome TaxID=412755 RepID=A0A0F9CTQ8_9ZZZZ